MTTRPTLSISGPANLLTAVPYLLGFAPEHSLVVVGLAHGELQCTFRVDMPGSIDHLDHLVSLTGQVETNNCDAVVIIAYGEADTATACIERTALEFDARGIDILDRFRVAEGRYYNLGCAESCCPLEGIPLTDRSAIAAALVAEGMGKRPDRDAINELFTPAEPDRLTAVARAVEDLLHAEADLSWAEQRQRDLASIDHWLEAGRLPEQPHHIATLGLALGDLDVRDYAMGASDKHASAALDLWLWVARHLESDLSAPALTIAGWCAYRTGNGVVAIDAFDHALEASPHYRLAQMLRTALQTGIPPNKLPVPSLDLATA